MDSALIAAVKVFKRTGLFCLSLKIRAKARHDAIEPARSCTAPVSEPKRTTRPQFVATEGNCLFGLASGAEEPIGLNRFVYRSGADQVLAGEERIEKGHHVGLNEQERQAQLNWLVQLFDGTDE